MKKLAALFLAILMVVSMSACTSKTSEPSETGDKNVKTEQSKTQRSETKQSEAKQSETKIFVDSAGRKVEVPVNITRIIPSGDMAQMFIWPLASDKLVSLASPLTKDQIKYLWTTKAIQKLPSGLLLPALPASYW